MKIESVFSSTRRLLAGAPAQIYGREVGLFVYNGEEVMVAVMGE